MKAKDVLKTLGITRNTLSTYVKKGIVQVKKLPNGYYDYNIDSVTFFNNIESNRIDVIYARVSTYKQRNDLRTQIEYIEKYCFANNISIENIFSDINSGIYMNRHDFNILINLVFEKKIRYIVISNKDRLTRLSFIMLSEIFKHFGTEIIVIEKKYETIEEELFDELISIMHYFSTKKYSNRRKYRKRYKVI